MNLAKFSNKVPRAQVTAGLRQLADYLDRHPGVPVPPYGWDLVASTHDDTDPEGIASVSQIAAILGVAVTDRLTDDDHYYADKTFGAVTYRAFHIPASLKPGPGSSPTSADCEPPQAAR